MSASPVDLTLFINPEHRPGEDLARRMDEHLEQVRLARSLGYEGVAIGHHLAFGSSVWLPPFETLARLVPETQGMSLATCMLVLPLFHPVHVAQQAAWLDVLCGGRFTLGVAPGWQRDEFVILGLDHHRRIGRFLESVRIIRSLWAGETLHFAGKHFTLEGERLGLRPARRPRPPMWFGGSVAAAVERIGAIAEPGHGDTWVPSSHLVADVVTGQAALYREALARRGETPGPDVPVLRNIVVAEDRETALREAGPALEASYAAMGQANLFTQIVGEASDSPTLDELIAGRVILGSPAEVTEELARLREALPYTRIIARVQWLGLPQPCVLRTIELLAREVAPAL